MNRRDFLRGVSIAMGALGVSASGVGALRPQGWDDLDQPVEGHLVTAPGRDPLLMPIRLYTAGRLVAFGLASSTDGEDWACDFTPGEIDPDVIIDGYEYDLLKHTVRRLFDTSFGVPSRDSLTIHIHLDLALAS